MHQADTELLKKAAQSPNTGEPSETPLNDRFDAFPRRHIGTNRRSIAEMLKTVGYDSIDALIDETVPKSIRLDRPLNLPEAKGEREALEELRAISLHNKVARSFIGAGYSDCVTPPVIQRNILENPGWYTAYTPYQAEIAQGRLEALLNFQTMITDLTGLDIANASMLDEATAAAEAMTLCRNVVSGRDNFFVSELCHPQTIEVVQTRAKPLGLRVIVGDHNTLDFAEPVFGVLLQYPATDGAIVDYSGFTQRAHDAGALVVVAADLLSLTLLKAPGEFGADVAVGNTQRFGVPLGFGGPHAAYMATRDGYKRHLPGRLVGVSHDAEGRPWIPSRIADARAAYPPRQGDEQHLHSTGAARGDGVDVRGVSGPRGLRSIAERVHEFAAKLAGGLQGLGLRYRARGVLRHIRVELGDATSADILHRAERAGCNLRNSERTPSAFPSMRRPAMRTSRC
jgi:glycine dehydrogenase